MVHIVDVECPKCFRRFRTVPSVVEHTGSVHCSVCGTRMNISEPRPVSVLGKKEAEVVRAPGSRNSS